MSKSPSMTSKSDRTKQFRELLKHDDGLLDDISTSKLSNSIAFDIHSLRIRNGMTQKDLAKVLGIQQSNISRWEKPGYEGYKVSVLNKIARRLNSRLHISFVNNINTTTTIEIRQEDTHSLACYSPDGSFTVETNTSINTVSFKMSQKQEVK